MKHNRLKQFFQDFYLALILLFLSLPLSVQVLSLLAAAKTGHHSRERLHIKLAQSSVPWMSNLPR